MFTVWRVVAALSALPRLRTRFAPRQSPLPLPLFSVQRLLYNTQYYHSHATERAHIPNIIIDIGLSFLSWCRSVSITTMDLRAFAADRRSLKRPGDGTVLTPPTVV